MAQLWLNNIYFLVLLYWYINNKQNFDNANFVFTKFFKVGIPVTLETIRNGQTLFFFFP